MKFLRLENGTLLNVNNINEIMKIVNLNSRNWEDPNRGVTARIEINTNYGNRTLFNVYASAPMKEGETWTYASGGGERTVRNIEDILDTMVALLIDKMNDEHEKIIGIDTRFLEDAMQAEVDRG